MRGRDEYEYLRAQLDYWQQRAEDLVGLLTRFDMSRPVMMQFDADPRIDIIKAAIYTYYDALNERKHGGVAMDKAFDKIEAILGLSWQEYKK